MEFTTSELLDPNPYHSYRSGTIGSSRDALRAGSYPQSVAVGDFDGDGVEDLAVANNGSDDVSILINNTPHVALPK